MIELAVLCSVDGISSVVVLGGEPWRVLASLRPEAGRDYLQRIEGDLVFGRYLNYLDGSDWRMFVGCGDRRRDDEV